MLNRRMRNFFSSKCAHILPVFGQLEERRLLSAAVEAGVLSVIGTDANDTITVGLNATDNTKLDVSVNGTISSFALLNADTTAAITGIRISGGNGNDKITVDQTNGGIALPVTLVGGNGQDTLTGGAGNDVLIGGNGKDNCAGGDGNDSVNGGNGKDVLDGGGGTNVIIQGKDKGKKDHAPKPDKGHGHSDGHSDGDSDGGLDVAGTAHVVLGKLVVLGTSGDDTITIGLNATDNAKIDVNINGTVTSFPLMNSDSTAAITGIFAVGGKGNDKITIDQTNGGILLNATLVGGGGMDSLTGGGGNDLLDGGADDDVLVGGDGNDTLNGGGGGADNLDGGAGTNVLVQGSDGGSDGHSDGGNDCTCDDHGKGHSDGGSDGGGDKSHSNKGKHLAKGKTKTHANKGKHLAKGHAKTHGHGKAKGHSKG